MVKVKVKFTLEQAMKAQTGSKLYTFFNLGTRCGWVVNAKPLPLYAGKDLAPIVQEAGWAPWPVRIGAENLAPTGIQSPDCPARGKSLYRLHIPGLLFS